MPTKKTATQTIKIQIPAADAANLAVMFIPGFAQVARKKLDAILATGAHPTLTTDDREVLDIIRMSLDSALVARLRGDR